MNICYIMSIILFTVLIIFNKKLSKSFIQTEQNEFSSKTYFQKWYEIANQISDVKSRISVCRYGDAEYMILTGKPVKSRDFFIYKGGDTIVKRDLLESLRCPKNGICYYGIWYEHFREFLDWSNQDPQYLVTANVFCNRNYPKTKDLLLSLIYDENKKIILFCNEEAKNTTTSFAEVVYRFPNEITSYYEANHDAIVKNATSLAKRYNNRLFILSIGPIAPILVNHMMKANLNNRYIDFGSTTDEILKERATREYDNPNDYYGKLIDKPFRIYKNKSIVVG